MSESRLLVGPSLKYKAIILFKKKDTEDDHWEVEIKGASFTILENVLESAWTLPSNKVTGCSSYSENTFLYRFFF